MGGVAHVRLLAVPREARQDQQRRSSGGFWVGDTLLVVHPVQRDLAAIWGADEFAEGQEMLCYSSRGITHAHTHTQLTEKQSNVFFGVFFSPTCDN